MTESPADQRSARTVRSAQLLLVAGAVALWAASRMPWVTVRSFDTLGPPTTTTVNGAQWSAGLLPLSVLLVVAAIAALAVRGWPLRMVALLVAITSLAIGYLGLSLWVVPDVAVRAADVAHVPVLSLVGSERHHLGAAITLSAAVCALAAAVLLLRWARSGGARTTKYATPGARRSMTQRNDQATSERIIWDALDEGRDPTDHPLPGSDTEGR